MTVIIPINILVFNPKTVFITMANPPTPPITNLFGTKKTLYIKAIKKQHTKNINNLAILFLDSTSFKIDFFVKISIIFIVSPIIIIK